MQKDPTTRKTFRQDHGRSPIPVQEMIGRHEQEKVGMQEQEKVDRQLQEKVGKQETGNTARQDHGITRKQDHGITRKQDDRVPFPKMILVAGDGRNVGKTTFCVQLIRNLSARAEVIAIKTTPHRHDLTDGLEVLVQTEEYIVALEKGAHRKDSALLRQAGAEKVYLIMAEQQHVGKAFSHISDEVQHKFCVAESGSLAAYVLPGHFFFIKDHSGEIKKKEHLEFDPVVVTNLNHVFDVAPEKMVIANNELRIVAEK